MSNQRFLMAFPLAALCAAVLHLPPASAAGQEGMVVSRDPESGRLRVPTPEEIKALSPVPTASMRSVRPQATDLLANPNGGRGLRLGDSSRVFSVVTRGTDGKLVEQCVHGPDAASALVTRPPVSQHKEHRHEDR